MRQRHAQRLGDDLRRRRRAEELAAAAGRCRRRGSPVSAASLERDLAVREARADRLHLAGVFALGRRQRHAAGNEDRRQIVHRRERHHHRGQSLVAGRDADARRLRVGSERISRRNTIAASLRYGRLSNMPVVPCVRPSQGSVTIAGERHRAMRLQLPRGGLYEQADLPVPGVIAERDRRCRPARARRRAC